MKPNRADDALKAYVLDVLARIVTAVRVDFVVKDFDAPWRVAPYAFGSVASAVRRT